MESINIVQLLLKSQNNLEWFSSHLNELLRDYDNKFVAIDNQNVIDSDDNFDALLKRLESKNIDPSDILIKFVSKIKIIL